MGIREEPQRRALTMAEQGLNVIYYQTTTTCFNGDQKISQPCNGGQGTGCSYDACMQHCFDEDDCQFFFHITSTSGCILYNSCDEIRTPAYSGTTVEVTRPSAAPTQAPTGLNVVFYETKETCANGDQKISQPCNGGKGTGCSYTPAWNIVLMNRIASSFFTSLQHPDVFFTTAVTRPGFLHTPEPPLKSHGIKASTEAKIN